MADRLFIDTSRLNFFDAPLKTLGTNEIKNVNAQIIRNNGTGFATAEPHFYNKVAFIQNNGGETVGGGGVILDYNRFFAWDAQNYYTAFGKMDYIDKNPFLYPNLEDWVIYYKTMRIGDYIWFNSEKGLPLYECEIMTTGHKFIKDKPTEPVDIYTPYSDMGKTFYCVRGTLESAPTPTHNYDEWIIITDWKVYNRKTGETIDRSLAVNRPNYSHNIYPVAVWDLQTLYGYRDSYTTKVGVYSGNFQATIMFNPLATFVGSFPSPSLPLFALGNWGFVNTTRTKTLVTDEQLINGNPIFHHSTLGENVKFLGAVSAKNKLVKWFGYSSIVSDMAWWKPDPKLDNSIIQNAIAFRTEKDFLEMAADWGITHITNDEQTAISQPSELFPGAPGGGFVPDDGNPTGYINDPVIPQIPSFPDNRSDIIDVVPPNISGLNAATVYALPLASVESFLSWLMTDSFINNISNLFSDKLSALNDLKLLPIDIVTHDVNHTTALNQIKIANVAADVPCYRVQAGYNCIIDGGSYQYSAYWGNFNDYTAANYYLYVPYGGIVEMSPSHVVNCEVTLKYALDLMTGDATAVIYSNGVLVKTVPCRMSQTVPITFTNTNQRDIKNALTALSLLGNVGGVVANAASGNIAGAVGGGLGIVSGIANGVMNNPLKIGSVGNFSSSTAFIMPQNAFLIISRVQLSNPSGLSKISGRPSNIYTTINNFVGSGFVQINVTHINTVATTEEQNQILNLLRGGIFI